uniref:Alpha/beta hydrolase fold-3 domain-containing protein n=1 Tax=Oryza sativa subsp. japonica TaxID=39947 RepID=Q7XIW8_ORYSJ|nr:hypothetical protein [Oryza sativa Japonica Group]BAD30313.1 hypothetical protein [Oryza sativa Japonica Group]
MEFSLQLNLCLCMRVYRCRGSGTRRRRRERKRRTPSAATSLHHCRLLTLFDAAGSSGAVRGSRERGRGERRIKPRRRPSLLHRHQARQRPPAGARSFPFPFFHPGGTITRPFVPDAPPSATGLVLSRDGPLDASLDTSPTSSRHRRQRQSSLVFYHASCEAMAAAVPAIVISLDYRLAPEHCLPAAYVSAVLWLRDAAAGDPWIDAPRGRSRVRGLSPPGALPAPARPTPTATAPCPPHFGGRRSFPTHSGRRHSSLPLRRCHPHRSGWREKREGIERRGFIIFFIELPRKRYVTATSDEDQVKLAT